MARANTKTWLSLDRWAELIGVNPLHFNGLTHGTLLPQTVCNDAWMQHAWQHADQVSREDVAYAIQQAEQNIANEVGYNLLPDWTVDERHPTSRPPDPTLYNVNALNVRGQRKSIQSIWGYVLSGGARAASVIQAGAAVVRSDSDGDTYLDTMTVTVATTITDLDQIRVFFPGKLGQDEWEIRPINISLAAGVATITFKSWLLVDPTLQEAINADAIPAEDANSYLTTVDVYRIYNDPQLQLDMLWEQEGFACPSCFGTGCTQCIQESQNGCLVVRNNRLGILAYGAGAWDAEEGEFAPADLAMGRDPDKVRLWYYSGWQDLKNPRSLNNLDPYWERAIAYYAASLLDRQTCGCSNITNLVKKLQRDHALSTGDESFSITSSQMDNNFGTTEGALLAFRATRRPERKIGR